jgi:hypothetical protein
MINIGIANNRKIYYQKYTSDCLWAIHLPQSNWLLLAVASGNKFGDLLNIATLFIEKNGSYACCAGDQGEMLHDIIDYEINNTEKRNKDLPSFDVISTWHKLSIENGLWSAIYPDGDEFAIINTVVCLDASSEDLEFLLRELIDRFNNGYIPPL